MSNQYYGLQPVKFNATLQGLLLLPANYDTTKKYPLIFHFCGNGEVGTDLNLLLNTGFGRQVANGKIAGTAAEKVINVIVQSPTSGAINKPNLFNAVWNYMVANYKVDLTTDENGQYKFVGLIGLSQGAADVWTIRTWDNSQTSFEAAVNGLKIKNVWIASIPATFPNAATYQRAKGGIYHFIHGTADSQGCCAYWPVPDMVKGLTLNGCVATLDTIQNGTHGNDVWDIAWSPLAEKSKNIYLSVLDGWTGVDTSPIVIPPVAEQPPVTEKTIVKVINVYSDGSVELI
ncbi:hypothetical protein QEG73_21960 [Chitinophagaceae bacterium 26-R-25]|nr:hypothetical protein [Chitinophagaceae bacterium 26-R-25]